MTAEAIGRADWEVRADQTGLVKDLNDAEAKVSASGQRVEKSAVGTGTAFKVAAATAALGFGLMAKGAVEMERAQGDFQAATGRSREEAVAFSKDMNGIVGTSQTVGASFKEITDAGTAVAQQFELTGEKGTALTERFLGFAKVTGQDATGAVNDFDAALDAFGEPAERATGLMDQLVIGNQKFGTDAGPAAVKALQNMAPALTAMGVGLDEGVALLNMFEAAGIDASKAPTALNKAVQELKPGENLDDLIAQIASIEDPLARGQKAAELFGTRTGVGLANAIKPGQVGLEGFEVSVEEAGGAAEKAAEDMVTTGDRIRMFAEKAGAALRGLGQEFGPLLSGVGGLTTAFLALPSKLTGPIVDGLKGTWTKVAASGPVKAAAGLAGAAAGAAYALGMKVADAVSGAVNSSWSAVQSKVGPGASSTGRAMGALMGVGIVLGLAAAAPAINAELTKIGQGANESVFGPIEQQAKGIAHGTIADSLVDGFHELWYLVGQIPMTASGQQQYFDKAVHDALAQGIDPEPIKVAFRAALDAGMSPEDAYNAAMAAAQGAGRGLADYVPEAVREGWRPAVTVSEEAGGDAAAAFGTGMTAEGAGEMERFRGLAEAQLERVIGTARDVGADIPKALADAATKASATRFIVEAADTLRDILKNGLTPEKQAMIIIGEDYSKLVGKGIRSGIPGADEAAVALALSSINTLEDAGLKGPRGKKSFKEMGELYDQLLASGMTAQQARVALAAAGVASETIDKLEGFEDDFDDAGEDSISAFGAGVTRAMLRVREKWFAQLHSMAQTAETLLKTHSPAKAGPWSKDGGPEGWMLKTGTDMVNALDKGLHSKRINPPELPIFGYHHATAGIAPAGLGMMPSISVGDINVTVEGVSSDNPAVVGEVVAEKVRDVLDDVIARASGGVHLRWTAGERS